MSGEAQVLVPSQAVVMETSDILAEVARVTKVPDDGMYCNSDLGLLHSMLHTLQLHPSLYM